MFPPMHKKAFGQRLRFLRKLEQMTQARLAEAVDVTVEHLSNIERGSSSPSFEMIMKLASALNTTSANLFLFTPFHLLDDEDESASGTETVLDWRGYVTRIGYFERDMLTGRVLCSRSLLELLGLAPSTEDNGLELLTRHVLEEDRASFMAGYQRLLEGNPQLGTFRFRRKDGLVRLGLAQAEMERDETGHPVRIFGLFMDITEQKRMEQSLVATHTKMEERVLERTRKLHSTVRRLEAEGRERKRAENQVSALSERLQSILDTITDGYYDHDIPSGMAFYSPSWGTMLGFSPEELGKNGVTWMDLIHPDDLPSILDRFQKEQVGMGAERMENQFRLRAKDGSWRWILSRGQVVQRDETGQPVRIVGVHTDISRLKVTMTALEESRGRLLRSQTLAQLGDWELEVGTGRLWWSDNLFRLFGYEPGEADPTMEFFLNHVHPDDVRLVLAEHARVRKEQDQYRVEYRFYRKDGAMRHGRSLADVLPPSGDKGLRLSGAFQDVTDRKRAELELLYSQERFRRMFHLAPLSMTRTTLDGTLCEVNQAFADLLGYQLGEMEGMLISDISHPEDMARNLVLRKEIMDNGGEGFQMNKRYIRKDGSLIAARLYVRVLPNVEGQACCMLGIVIPDAPLPESPDKD